MELVTYNSSIRLAWHAFCDCLEERLQIKFGFQELSETKLKNFNGLTFMCEMKLRELLNDGKLFYLQNAFRRVLYDWLSSICSVFRVRYLPSNAEVVPFCLFLTKNIPVLQAFWEEDYPRKVRGYKIVEEEALYFPMQSVGLLELLFVFCGNEENEFTNNVIEYLMTMSGYTHNLVNQNILVPASRGIDIGGSNIDDNLYLANDDYTEEGIPIPKNAKAQILEKKPNNTGIVRWDIQYSAWPLLFAQSERLMNNESTDANSYHNLSSFLKLLCRIISLNPRQANAIENLIVYEDEGPITKTSKILALFGSAFQYYTKFSSEDGLQVIQAIINSMSKLYETEDMKGQVVNLVDSLPRIYAEKNAIRSSQVHTLVCLFKGFRQQEISSKTNIFSQSILELAISLVKDYALHDNFGGRDGNSFFSDFLQFVFDDIIRPYNFPEAKDSSDTIFITRSILELIYHMLLKFRTTPNKLRLDLPAKKMQPLMRLYTHLLNRVSISSILLQAVSVFLTTKSSTTENIFDTLHIQNRLWHEFAVNRNVDVNIQLAIRKSIALVFALTNKI